MIAYLEEMIAKVFGQRQEQPIRVRAHEEQRGSDVMKGRE